MTGIDTAARGLALAGLLMATPYVKADTTRYMLSGNGWRGPTQQYVPGASAIYGVSEKWYISDDYWTFGHRWLLSNWKLTTAGAGGQEAANGNSIDILAFSVVVGSTTTQIAINGGTSTYTLADDSEIWTDAPAFFAMPPRTRFCIRVAWKVPNSASNISTPYPGIRPHWGDKAEVSASDLSAKVLAGGISTAIPSGNNVYCYTPIAMAAQGWDGREVVLGFGTSIAQGVGQSRLHAGPYGEIGPIGRGLVSTKGGALRLPGVIWAVSGGLAAGIDSASTNHGLTRRKRALDALSATPPMTTILSDFGTNDATATLSAWQTAMANMWTAIKTVWPTIPLLQTPFMHRVASSNGFIDVAGQSAQNANWTLNTGTAWAMHRWQQGLTTQYFDVYLDGLHDVMDNFSGGGTKGTWRTDVLDSSWSTTLSATISAGATSMTMAAMPRAGAILALSDNPEALIVLSATGTAAPFGAGLAATAASGHTSGATIKEAVSAEGTHPGDLFSAFLADAFFAPAKLAGRFMRGR